MNEVHTMPMPATMPVPQLSDTANLATTIERLALNPAIDPSKLRELLEFRRQIVADANREAFDRAYVKLQGMLDPVVMRGVIDIGRGGKNQKYAKFEHLHSSIRAPMMECGLALSFRLADPAPGTISITTILMGHGHREETTLLLPYDTTGSKNNVQSRGSSISYGRRYGAISILNLATTDEDDDGAAGGGTGPIDEEQRNKIEDKIVEAKADREKFCNHLGVTAIENLPASQYDEAIAALDAKIAENKKKAKQ